MAIDNLTIIVAMAQDGAIGNNGDLLCRLREDLKRFKQLTMGHPIIMGRKTFESLPKGALPGRRNIVITRNTDYFAPGAEVVHSLADAIVATADADERFIIGGAQIYTEAFPIAGKLQLTRIHSSFPNADTRLSCFNPDEWEAIETPIYFAPDDNNEYGYSFEVLKRVH